MRISSGLGDARASNIIVLPALFEGEVKAVLELASFERFSAVHTLFLDQLMESIGIVFHTIQANSRTEALLEQSQSLATELQSRQLELQKTNAELEEKATLLAEQNAEVERKNTEVEQARQALEEKASQLALTSKYKSEFLANMMAPCTWRARARATGRRSPCASRAPPSRPRWRPTARPARITIPPPPACATGWMGCGSSSWRTSTIRGRRCRSSSPGREPTSGRRSR